ncbi:hypothetical protein RJ640_004439 [Escallonia rubra]|uniref:Phytocyanin domain-containing protein n=1 Tax=Escallonia rubra TaxID=112253 RepID=A0AA88QEZ9_9ASTE|nr:hypothetical protein RJ640_004439 [Escallonia rubra]
MALEKSLCLFLALVAVVIRSSDAYTFVVGGRDGWVVKPSEDYNLWSQRLRFLINDTLYFKYNKGSDSVLVVNKDDYDKCNTAKPIKKFDDGSSFFTFDRSGPFYFISGNKSNCDKGQKLLVVVLAVRFPPMPKPPAPAPPTGHAPPTLAPAIAPKSPSPGAHAPSPATHAPSPATHGPSPATHAPSPATHGPSPATYGPSPATYGPSPATHAPSPVTHAPSPATHAPAPSPVSHAPVPSNAPANSPLSPAPSGKGPAVSPAPATHGPVSPSTGPASGNTPADVRTPPPSSAPAFTPSVVLVSTVSLVLSVAFSSFITSP